ncbi:sorting nexin-25-like isoform X1 [Denticeps clupeoides]|uniref:sorting nexin-25-like isoform X1 n=1 Tax=Denticeps clupeoides TaxID=299321 RepID=UPI0010A3F289|nr:sorting nexin-25-like isoform X1 [Denticeps clupeoides]
MDDCKSEEPVSVFCRGTVWSTKRIFISSVMFGLIATIGFQCVCEELTIASLFLKIVVCLSFILLCFLLGSVGFLTEQSAMKLRDFEPIKNPEDLMDLLRQMTFDSVPLPESAQTRQVVVSPSVDKALKEVFDYAYRDYILPWYERLSSDDVQLYQLLLEDFWEVVGQLRARLAEADVVDVVCDDIMKALHAHFCNLKTANTMYEEQPQPFALHPCLSTPETEQRFLRCCTRMLLLALLPTRHAQSHTLRLVLSDVFMVKVLKPLVEVLSDPDYINRMLLFQLEQREHQMELHRKAYTYAPSYEEFIKLISNSNDVDFLKKLRYEILLEIFQATTINSLPQVKKNKESKGKEKAIKTDLLRARNMKRYINQLTVAKKQCEKRICLLGGPNYEQQEDSTMDDVEVPHVQMQCQTMEASDLAQDQGSPGIDKQASYATDRLRQLNSKLQYKRQTLGSIQNSPKPDKKVIFKMKEEIGCMEKEQSDLQLHISRTDLWCTNLGMWRATVTSGELVEENGEQTVSYCVSVSLADVDDSTQNHWEVFRKLCEFQALHRKLVQCFPLLKKIPLPVVSKLPFRSIDQKFLEKSKIQLNYFLQKLLSDECVCQCEEVYAFLSPSPELLKVMETQKKSTFCLTSFLERLPGDFFSPPEEDTDDDSDLSDYGEELDGRKDVLAEPFFMLIGEIFELRGMFKWVRKTLISLVQVTFGWTINKQIRETVNWIFGEQMLVCYISVFRDTLWPDGIKASLSNNQSKAQRHYTREQAQKKLLDSIPDALQNLVGQQNARFGVIRIFNALQEASANKHLLYVFMEILLRELCPELSIDMD